jgi:CheY-like chemotaxis protein
MSTAEWLRGMGHEVAEAGTGEQAMALLRERPEVDLLITDLGLPGMSGQDLVAAARQLRPALPVLLASGYDVDGAAFPGLDRVGWLAKPFTVDDLARARSALGAPERTVRQGPGRGSNG